MIEYAIRLISPNKSLSKIQLPEWLKMAGQSRLTKFIEDGFYLKAGVEIIYVMVSFRHNATIEGFSRVL